MARRLLGLETEYAIRFTPEDGGHRPGNQIIYKALAGAIGDLVETRPGQQRSGEIGRIFTASGATFCYENLPTAIDGGLIEGGTPECADPSQLLLYQKANDALLIEALPGTSSRLHLHGFRGELALLKNCRDAEGHVYGAQENYEAQVARGPELVLYRVALTLVLPFVALTVLLIWSMVLVVLIVLLVALLAALIATAAHSASAFWAKLLRSLDPESPAFFFTRGHVLLPVERVVGFWGTAAGSLLFRVFAFRSQRAALLGFLVSRPIWSGAGTVHADGRFGLSEKGPAIRRVIRRSPAPGDRPIFDTGNLLKDLLSPARLQLRPLLRLYGPRQRMQLGLSDSNCAQTAEYLKAAITALVLDMAEAGWLGGAPRLLRPVEALHTIVADASLTARVDVAGGAPMSALELQHEYLARAKAYLRQSAAPSLQAHRAVALWEQVLSALQADPGRLVGRIDWVSKRYLIEACAGSAPLAVQKKIDLRYHELQTGYFAEMERAGIAPRLVSDEEIAHAKRTAPEGTPARMRGQLVKNLAGSPLPVQVSWHSVRIGAGRGGKVIRLVRPPEP